METAMTQALSPSAAVSAATSGQVVSGQRNAMGKEEFLQLLMTQMQYQDPLNPMDNSAMVAQLAQFSALEQMQNLNQEFQGFRQENGLIQALLLTGRSVSLEMTDGTQVEGVVDRVIRENGETFLRIGETEYSMNDIKSLALTETEGTAEPIAQEPTQEPIAQEEPMPS